jgi:N4-gp56 family major capsid protein
MRTFIGVNDPQTVKKWADSAATSITKTSYFAKSMMGSGEDTKMPIQQMTGMQTGAGDEITFDLLMPMQMNPIVGDETLKGKEAQMRFYVDRLRVDQVRGGVNLGSRMTQKRTLRDLRKAAKRNLVDWWARLYDELFFVYLSGTRGTMAGFTWPADSAYFNINALTAPDALHQLYPNAVTSKLTMTSADTCSLRLVDRAIARAETMGGDSTDEISMLPCEIDGDKRYVYLMHTFQFDALKTSPTTGQWLDIQKAAAAAQGQGNPIYKGIEGMYAGVILRKHRNVVGSSDYGAGVNLQGRRSLFLGAQAAVIAFGDRGEGMSFDWTESLDDHDNTLAIGAHAQVGVKKTTYKSKDGLTVRDFGVIAIDTFAADPNP